MDFTVRLFVCLVIVITAAVKVHSSWKDPPFLPVDDRVTIGDYVSISQVQPMNMDEEIEPDVVLARLNFDGDFTPFLDSISNNNTLGLILEENDNSWQLVVTKKIDYEALDVSDRTLTFDVYVDPNASGGYISVQLSINNIDDNPPYIEIITNPCQIDENYIGPSDCEYIISDADGWINYITMTVTGTRNESELFEFVLTPEPSNDTYSASASIHTKQMLDYETITLHVITWTVTDTGNQSATQRVVVNVNDLPDTPPKWTSIFSTEQFDEKTTQEFTVTAIDGDIGINDDIIYYIRSEEWNDTLFYIEEKTGIIHVPGIDRDTLQTEIFTFLIFAQEVNEPKYSTNQSVTFVVRDVNDNAPTIIDPDDKILTITIPEALMTSLSEYTITVLDRDSTENAIYNVALVDPSTTEFSSAFLIVPTQGYQEYTFSMSIVNSTLLDYEDETWRSFSFEVFFEETVNASHTDTMTVFIELTNWNDETPIFTEDEYVVQVLENVTVGEVIATVRADDRDVGDKVVYSLIGSSIQRRLEIDYSEGDGLISTIIDDAFDYERQTEWIVQIAATDTLEDDYGTRHTTYAQLTIEILDVNDEQPSISVNSAEITVEENRPDETTIVADITATDEDTTANLLFSIDWESSSAAKNGRRIDLGQYENCITVTTQNISEIYGGYVRALLTVNEVVDDNTPDYEIFDTLYLMLVVTDLNQEQGEDSASVRITISIIDLNDNYPIFTSSVDANNTVTEAAAAGVTIGSIAATDDDGYPEYNTVSYYIEPIDGTPDGLVEIGESTGLLTVTGDIDADDPHTWYLNYTVTATDGELSNSTTIRIYIIDINDNTPVIEAHAANVPLEEKSDNNTEVIQIKATDKDRDMPFNVIWFTWTTTSNSEVRSFFSIDMDTGLIYVHYRSEDTVLDRDFGTSSFEVGFQAADNYLNQGGTQRSSTGTFTITLTDINDQKPIISTTEISVSESVKSGTQLDTQIVATDDDEPGTDNSRINFEITSITNEDGDVLDQDLFSIATDDNFDTGIAYLTTLEDLKDYYGEYTLNIQTNDLGIPINYMDNSIKLVIEKYNYESPTITYPEDGLRIYLRKTQSINSQLYLYNDMTLPNIQATDNQNGKWDITFDIAEEDSIFYVDNSDSLGQSTGMLKLNTLENWGDIYTLTIVANDNGTPPDTARATLNVRFFDLNSLPYFPEGQRELSATFTENSTGLAESIVIPRASYTGADESDFDVYYLLLVGDSDIFEVDVDDGTITLKEMLDREEVDSYNITVIASNSQAIPSEYDGQSLLEVYIQVLDVNDNPPHFERIFYSGGISTSTTLNTVITTVVAYDLDVDDVLTYYLDTTSMTTSDSSIASVAEPFKVGSASGEITLNFAVQSNMAGYFAFNVIVVDSPPENHTDATLVQIYIVTDDNRVEFTFENNLNTVVSLRSTIQDIFEELFEYTCNIDSILSDTDDTGAAMDTQTVVTVHFIDSEANAPVNRTTIQTRLSDLTFYSNLRSALINSTLYLLSYTSSSTTRDNTEELLKAWLIGVSVVSVFVCITLLVAFIVKIRQLKKRLNKVTEVKFGSQESGLNRIGVAAFPNTNKNAVEGANPVYNEEKKMPDFDDSSIHSGDSDLIGVEDNPEFDYGVQNTRKPEVIERY